MLSMFSCTIDYNTDDEVDGRSHRKFHPTTEVCAGGGGARLIVQSVASVEAFQNETTKPSVFHF